MPWSSFRPSLAVMRSVRRRRNENHHRFDSEPTANDSRDSVGRVSSRPDGRMPPNWHRRGRPGAPGTDHTDRADRLCVQWHGARLHRDAHAAAKIPIASARETATEACAAVSSLGACATPAPRSGDLSIDRVGRYLTTLNNCARSSSAFERQQSGGQPTVDSRCCGPLSAINSR